ncbi:MAG: LLM class flavin-dependent oxidoreductase, partial [Pseudomonadales bacterium]|nr:LLM class flavin-dependent oxidoreductase [Pseudomonadales bacterium]
MALRVETVMMGPETAQYAGQGQAATGVARIAAQARALEDLGFDGITTPEAGHDPFLPLAIAAEHTTRVRLGTNVAIAFPRSPMVTAQCAWDLQGYSGGRFALGIGTQIKGHNERRYATPWPSAPGPRMREYVLCVRAMLRSFQDPGSPEYFEGEHYRFTMIPPFFNP